MSAPFSASTFRCNRENYLHDCESSRPDATHLQFLDRLFPSNLHHFSYICRKGKIPPPGHSHNLRLHCRFSNIQNRNRGRCLEVCPTLSRTANVCLLSSLFMSQQESHRILIGKHFSVSVSPHTLGFFPIHPSFLLSLKVVCLLLHSQDGSLKHKVLPVYQLYQNNNLS